MSFEQVTALLAAIEKKEDQLTAEHWNYSPNPRKLTQLKGSESSPQALLIRISTLHADELKELKEPAKKFILELIRYVLAANPKVTLKPTPSKTDLVTFLKLNKFSSVFGIKKRATNDTEIRDITEEEINDYIDRITERGLRTVPIHNPKRIRRTQAHALGLRFFTHCKLLLKDTYPEAVISPDLYDRNIQALVMTWGDIGTTKSVDYGNVEITFFFHPKPTTSSARRYEVSGLDLIVPTLSGLLARRVARYFALPAVNFAKQHNHKYAVGQMHGVPPQYGYLGFDFNDMLPANNPTEAIVIAQARAAGLFNEVRYQGQYTNTSVQFQKAGHDRIQTGNAGNA